MLKRFSKILIAVGLVLCASAAFATSVTVTATDVTNHSGTPIAPGAYVQVIDSADANAGAPDANGLPQGDTVIEPPVGVTISGGFSGIRNITAGNYVYIRVWENWDGTGTPPVGAYYGTSTPENVGTGFIMLPSGYNPPAFSTTTQYGVTTLNITTTSLAGGTQGVSYSRSVSATGGTAPYTWSISAGSLPAGLSLNASSGLISGTPTGTGTSNFTVQCSDSGAQTDTQALSINIGTAAQPTVTGISPTSGNQGATVPVTISGSNTTWTGGETITVAPDTGITVSNVGGSGTSLTADFVIDATAPLTARTITVSGAQGSATFTVNQNGGGGITVTPSNAYVGQTIVVTGSGFGANPGTITVGGATANPTAWSDNSVTCAVPSGATSGNVVIGADDGAITITAGGVIIDDFEGGSVGSYAQGMADSGYYTYGTGITPDNSTINADGPQASAASHGSRGMNILYSYTSDWGGGWGASVSNRLDLSAYASDTLTFYVNWDGSSNVIKLSLKDANDVVYAASVSNMSLNQAGYHAIQVAGSSLVWDADDPANVQGTLDWSQIVSYGFSYPSQGTNANYQNIDSFYAGTVNFPDGPVVPTGESEVVITQIEPNAGPAGTKFTGIGSGFGNSQGQSVLVFENNTTHTSYQCDVLSWSDTSIEAIVPRLAPAGDYTLKVIRLAIAQGTIQAYESNPAAFKVTSGSSSTGNATIYPNPFNPRSADPTHNTATIGYNTNATVIGIYIYDATARLAYHQTTSDQVSTTWDGKDMNGNHVADGLYILRVVNEENKSLISKGKILVIKQ
ncbi:MAG: IPT/TIG domain-containing protein [Candidatus Margulisiibacteriota bacterium]|nr:IPT/TIG domain-containing protein [Candidatus Margulisiibacteriota bacterium]